MHFKGGLLFVFIFVLCNSLTVDINVKSKFSVGKNKRIFAMHYEEAIIQSLAACSAVCQSSGNCTAANYFEEMSICHIFNKVCFLTEEVAGWTYLTRLQAHGTFQHIANMTKTWDGAKNYCESIGGGLANIYTQADYDMVLSVIGQSLNWNGVWLGGSDIQSEGEWIWSNGCRFNDQVFSIWMGGEPNNDRDQDCLRLRGTVTYNGWDDVWCTELLDFVCEFIVA